MNYQTHFFVYLFLLQSLFLSPKESDIIINFSPILSSSSCASSDIKQSKYQISETLSDLKSSAISNSFSLSKQLYQNKGKICALTITLFYFYMYQQTNKANSIMKNHNSWCNWKQTVALQHLVASNHKDLISELLLDIQKKYLFSKEATLLEQTSCQTIHARFIQDICSEIKLLENYVLLQKSASNWYSLWLFSFSFDLQEAEEKLARLHVLTDIFAMWKYKNTNQLLS